jgi:hypothetical protein
MRRNHKIARHTRLGLRQTRGISDADLMAITFVLLIHLPQQQITADVTRPIGGLPNFACSSDSY